MRLILVRHGDAHAGLTGTISGPKGCRGLTDLGRVQATRLRDHLNRTSRLEADLLISSVLPRAIETAAIIAPALGFDEVPQDCDLCEVHTGEADGLDWADYTGRFGPLDMVAEPNRVFAPGGDSWTSFHDRVHRLLDRLADDHRHDTVVAVCHAGVIAASLTCLLGIRSTPRSARLLPTNTGLTEWHHDTGTDRWTLRSYNDTTHLQDDAPSERD